jgi:hypothetical protein
VTVKASLEDKNSSISLRVLKKSLSIAGTKSRRNAQGPALPYKANARKLAAQVYLRISKNGQKWTGAVHDDAVQIKPARPGHAPTETTVAVGGNKQRP